MEETQSRIAPNPLGLYRDPESGAELTAQAEAQADAFVKMGWKLVEEAVETKSSKK